MNVKTMMAGIIAVMVALSVATVIASDESLAVTDDAEYMVDGTGYSSWEDASQNVKDGSRVTLTKSGSIAAGAMVLNNNLIFDLAGNTLTVDGSGLTALSGGIKIGTSSAVTLMDSSSEGTGKIITTSTNVVTVLDLGSLTIESGSIVRDVPANTSGSNIQVNGTLIVNGGSVQTITDEPGDDDKYIASNILNRNVTIINDGEILNNVGDAIQSGVSATISAHASVTINGGYVEGGGWGVTVFGTGMKEDGSVDNDASILTITGGTVTVSMSGGQAIGTNASGGKNAGHTITISGGTVVSSEGTGIYAPSYGIYNITGGVVSGEQGIRIAAGILNISDGAVIQSSAPTEYDGMVSGGNGGSTGALVIGKAGTGYVGNLDVNITGGTIENSNSNGDAIVLSDAYMGKEELNGFKISLNMTGGSVFGDVHNITGETYNLDGDQIGDGQSNPSKDNVSLDFTGGSINGDIFQESKGAGLTLNGTSVTGNVLQSNQDVNAPEVSIESGIISGEVPDYAPENNTLTLVVYGESTSVQFYNGKFTIPYVGEPSFLGWSTSPNATTATYADGATIASSEDITLYAVFESETPAPSYDEDEGLPPFIPQQQSNDDDTTLYIACCAAAAVVALLAIIIVMNERKR